MGARSRLPRHQPLQLKFVHSLGHRDPRRVVPLSKLRFARQPVAGPQRSVLNCGVEFFVDLPVPRSMRRRRLLSFFRGFGGYRIPTSALWPFCQNSGSSFFLQRNSNHPAISKKEFRGG